MEEKPKALVALNEDDYSYPLADVSSLSYEEKVDLFKRGMHQPQKLHSDEEFEQWVTLFAEWNKYSYPDGHEPTEKEREHDRMTTASIKRAMWYHNKRFKAWKKEHLQPLIDELVGHAAHAPQYDWQFLYGLEYAKLRCMKAYFSHSLIADDNGDFGFNRWIDTCINLLEHLKNDGVHISDDQIRRMNIRNVRDVVSSSMIDDYLEAPIPRTDDDALPDKFFYGRKIYVRKMERLYYRIRLYKMREWWE